MPGGLGDGRAGCWEGQLQEGWVLGGQGAWGAGCWGSWGLGVPSARKAGVQEC